MGGQFDDTWLDDSYNTDETEFVPTDPFEGMNKRDQDLFFRMLDIVPDEKREQVMEYFVDHPKKIREVIKVMKQKRKIVEDKDLGALRTVFSEYRVQFETKDNASDLVEEEDIVEEAEENSEDGY
ncbi:MAG: hypothetical protein ACD_41C00177G0002 [uncultured bacterium]|nr:MAG: hypothetical protein ACD_41C00177G0002 [uncultured bacterium]